MALDTIAFGIPCVALTLRNDEGRSAYRVGKAWARFNLWAMDARIETRGLCHVDPEGSYVVMCNHVSHLDVWSVMAVLPLQLRWVMKHELRRIPLLGYACQRMGQIYVMRGFTTEAKASMELAARRIREGSSVVFFPEGTRSRTGDLGTFKTGGFRLAIASGAPILPMSVSGTSRMLPADGWRYRAGDIHITIGEPIPTMGLDIEDMPKLMETTRKAILAGLESACPRW